MGRQKPLLSLILLGRTRRIIFDVRSLDVDFDVGSLDVVFDVCDSEVENDVRGIVSNYTSTVRDAEHLGRILQQARLLGDLTQREVADALGVTQKAVYEMESGQPTKYAQRLFRMMDELGVTMTIEIPEASDRG